EEPFDEEPFDEEPFDEEPLGGPADGPYASLPEPTKAELMGEQLDLRDGATLGDDPYAFIYRASLKAVRREAERPENTSRRAELLFAAIDADRGAVVRWLLDLGVDPNASDEEGRSLLAAALHRSVFVEMLLAAGADPSRDPLLLHQTFDGPGRGFQLALDAGADPNAGPLPPLFRAVETGNPRAVRALLCAGADPDVVDPSGLRPVDHARMIHRSRRDPTSLEVLRLLGAQPSDAAQDEVDALEPVRAILQPYVRSAWRPEVREGEGSPTAARYGGRPWLPRGEWPRGPSGQPLTFLLQLDGRSVPELAIYGLLQVFEDPSDPLLVGGAGVVRVISTEEGALGRPPAGVELLRAFEIVDVEPLQDHPSTIEIAEGLLEGEVAMEGPLLEWEDQTDLGLTYAGDKFGGWPAWIHGPERPPCPVCGSPATKLIAQLARGPTHADTHSWGDLGTYYLFRCPSHAEGFGGAWQG
ncbi:MAG: DUF1963 domain-containing protein, partial [Deltaproteobacteria bacterium]